MKRVFLTFADLRLHRSLTRISRQAQTFSLYDEIITADESTLDAAFVEHFHSRLVSGSRGFGYWCWKPQIILQSLEQMEEGDVLQYTDVGCHLNIKGKKRLLEYFEMTADSEKGILAFQAKLPEFPLEYDGRKLLDLADSKWTKGDLLDYFRVRHNPNVVDTQSIGSGIIFIRKCPEAVRLIQKWLQIYYDDFALIDDTPSLSPNLSGFIENRHDQAVFSILCKLSGISTISAYEYWYPKPNSKRVDWQALERFPIHAKRDKNLGIFQEIRRILIKVFQRAGDFLFSTR